MHNGSLAETLEQPEQGLVSHPGQALVDKHLRRGENDAAVDIVLFLACRLVADPNRTHAEKAFEIRRDPFIKRRKRHNAVQRLDLIVAAGDGGDIVDVGFHDLRRAEPVQRVDDEIGVTQPTVSIIPGS